MIHDKITQNDIAGVVVLYNSPFEVFDNIITYLNQVKRLYVVDNSTKPNHELVRALQSYKHISYYSLNENMGIATALNWAASRAVEDGFVVLITMDDDTRTPGTMVLDMIEFWNRYTLPIGILSGVHKTDADKISNIQHTSSYRTLPYTMASGNMLNLVAYQKIGGFYDELFIDHVDNEYGLRLNKNGYQVVELTNIELEHSLGYRNNIKIGNWIISKYTTHQPVRLYYYSRNSIHLVRSHLQSNHKFTWVVTKELVKYFIKAAFLDTNRISRLRMLIRGVRDGWRGHLGKYKE